MGERVGARGWLVEALARSDRSELTVDALLARLRTHGRVTLNFHPDRCRPDGTTVAEGLLRDGIYRNQFEVGVTNGSPTAKPGGERDEWERRLFGGAYHAPGVPPVDRPKYGALNLLHHADGGSPRFGSCYLELKPNVLERCTFTWGDSHQDPAHVGTLDAFEPVLATLFHAVESKGEALGISGFEVPQLLQALWSLEVGAAREPASRRVGRALDDYIEAQVHGDLEIAADVETVVVDPAFEGTSVGESLRALASRYGIVLAWHPGFVLSAHDVPADFRGPLMVPLARRVTDLQGVDLIDALSLGNAAASLHHNPSSWAEWGPPDETWQHLKQLWHVLVRFGRRRGLTAGALAFPALPSWSR